MAVKLSVGLQKKIGLPDYGSLGASCFVEFEVDRTALDKNLDHFHQKVRGAFNACQQAVNDQLTRHQSNPSRTNGHAHNINGKTPARTNGNRNGGGSGKSRSATANQTRAIRAIADRQKVNLNQLLSDRFNVHRPEELSISDASSLIDELKDSPAGSTKKQ